MPVLHGQFLWWPHSHGLSFTLFCTIATFSLSDKQKYLRELRGLVAHQSAVCGGINYGNSWVWKTNFRAVLNEWFFVIFLPWLINRSNSYNLSSSGCTVDCKWTVNTLSLGESAYAYISDSSFLQFIEPFAGPFFPLPTSDPCSWFIAASGTRNDQAQRERARERKFQGEKQGKNQSDKHEVLLSLVTMVGVAYVHEFKRNQ